MIFSNFTYNGITFSRFIRGAGYQAEVIAGDRIAIRSTRDPLPAQPGIQRYLDEYGSRLLEIRGFVKGTSEAVLYTKIAALLAAFDVKMLEASTSGSYGFLPLDWTDPGQNAARYYLKPLTNTLIVTEDRTGLARRFSVLLEAKDPTKYSTSSITYTITVGTSGTGNSGFSIAFPVGWATVSGFGLGTVTNSGTAPVFPQSIRLNGPATGTWAAPKVTNTTTGEYFQFTSAVTLTVGQYVTISPSIGTAQKYNGSAFEDVSAYFTSGSTLFQLPTGNSTILLEGSTIPNSSNAVFTIISSFA